MRQEVLGYQQIKGREANSAATDTRGPWALWRAQVSIAVAWSSLTPALCDLAAGADDVYPCCACQDTLRPHEPRTGMAPDRD